MRESRSSKAKEPSIEMLRAPAVAVPEIDPLALDILERCSRKSTSTGVGGGAGVADTVAVGGSVGGGAAPAAVQPATIAAITMIPWIAVVRCLITAHSSNFLPVPRV
ncbi:MAG TPA: hypothetical protein VGQ58_04165 [Candidatus Limnocylindrales bacterium]|nr:hypothetical protein [Candidatus Limnocylindrales bacterium]